MRADQRRPDEYREIKIKKGLCLSSQGSAQLSYGPTQVIATINGPKELRYREVGTRLTQINVKTFPEKRELNDIIITALRNSLDLEAYPDTYIDVCITIVCDDGSLISCAINAALLALYDASLKIKKFAFASCLCFKGTELYIDPTKHEEDVLNVSNGVVTFLYSDGTTQNPENNSMMANPNNEIIIFSCYFEGLIEPEMMMAAISRASYNLDIIKQLYSQ